MKIGFFTDVHYCDSEYLGLGRKPRVAIERVREAMQVFKEEGVELCFCLGDMTDHAPAEKREDALRNMRECVSIIRGFGIPFYLVPGNHDYLMLTGKEMEGEGLRLPPYVVETQACRLIALDANYRSSMQRFDVEGEKWDDANLPPAQLEFLDKELSISKKPCFILIHENLDPSVDSAHIVKNAEKAREIISRHKERVKMVIQGHYHYGSQIEIDTVPYLTLSAMCIGEENPYKIIEI